MSCYQPIHTALESGEQCPMGLTSFGGQVTPLCPFRLWVQSVLIVGCISCYAVMAAIPTTQRSDREAFLSATGLLP